MSDNIKYYGTIARGIGFILQGLQCEKENFVEGNSN